MIYHRRNDDNYYWWSYDPKDWTDLDGDDRGMNVGLIPENPNQGWFDLYGYDYGDWLHGRSAMYDQQEQQDAF